jgi:hypothetical protein
MDITRVELDVRKHYASGRLPQGKPIMDADANHASVLFETERRLTNVDVIGAYGSPDDGFRIGNQTTGPDGRIDFMLGPGALYLGGLRLTIEPDDNGQGVWFSHQTDWLQQALQDRPPPDSNGRRDLVVLEAYEYDVSAVEDGEMIDPAVGVDTYGWRRRMRRAHVLANIGEADCASAFAQFVAALGTLGPDNALQTDTTLTATFNDAQNLGDLCNPPIAGGYLGAQNQAIRVELLDGSRLLWAFDNSAPLYRVSIDATGLVLTLDTPPRDQVHWPLANQTVEVIAWAAVLPNGEKIAEMRGALAGAAGAPPVSYLTTVATGYAPASGTIKVASAPPAGFNATWQGRFLGLLNDADAGRKALMRIWWRGDDVSALPISYTPGTPVALGNTGISVTISGTAPRSGEHWTIAVRPKTPNLVYPWQLATGRPPDGPRLYYAPLGILTWNGVTPPHDCRPSFAPLIDAGECCEVTLKPHEDWQGRLAQAMAAGDVSLCFEPGLFVATATIRFSKKAVKITGAGVSTRIVGDSLEVVLEFDECQSVVLSDISVRAGVAGTSSKPATAHLQGAVTLRGCGNVQVERVLLACADADLRAASCLAIYNPIPIQGAPPEQFNASIRQSRFQVGHFQVGILLVNADRALVEDNVVITLPQKRNIKYADLANRPAVAHRLHKQLVWGMSVTSTAPPKTRKARARLRKRQPAGLQADQGHPAEAPAGQAAVAPAETATARPAARVHAAAALHLNLAVAERARVNASYGMLRLEFISSNKLGSAWNDALSTLSANSSAGQIHAAVSQIARNALTKPGLVAPAFRNWVSALLPALFSTSSQGIVVGGDLANDVRIINNTIDGTVQGVHVGLSDLKVHPHQPHLFANRVQICGNTIHIRLTPEATGDRHGIFLGCVKSAVVSDNHMDLTGVQAGQDIYAIKIAGSFGPLVLVERNSMLSFTGGILTDQDARMVPSGSLWKVAENVSSSPHDIHTPYFRVADNLP